MAVLNPEKYRALVASRMPREITTDQENHARIQELEALLLSPSLTPEEDAYCQVLVILIQHYERKFRLGTTLDPIQTLRVLLSNRDMEEIDLVTVLGCREIHVSELLNGDRELSITEIQKLSDFFHVSPDVFFRSSVTP